MQKNLICPYTLQSIVETSEEHILPSYLRCSQEEDKWVINAEHCHNNKFGGEVEGELFKDALFKNEITLKGGAQINTKTGEISKDILTRKKEVKDGIVTQSIEVNIKYNTTFTNKDKNILNNLTPEKQKEVVDMVETQKNSLHTTNLEKAGQQSGMKLYIKVYFKIIICYLIHKYRDDAIKKYSILIALNKLMMGGSNEELLCCWQNLFPEYANHCEAVLLVTTVQQEAKKNYHNAKINRTHTENLDECIKTLNKILDNTIVNSIPNTCFRNQVSVQPTINHFHLNESDGMFYIYLYKMPHQYRFIGINLIL